jgi:hypothetical protein
MENKIILCNNEDCIHCIVGLATGIRICEKDSINLHFDSLGNQTIAICDSSEYANAPNNITGTIEQVIEKDDKMEIVYKTPVGQIKNTILKIGTNIKEIPLEPVKFQDDVKTSFHNATLYRVIGADVISILKEYNKLEKYSEDKLVELFDFIEHSIDLNAYPHIHHLIELFEKEGYLDDN